MKEINNLLSKLEEAIRKGDDQQAAELAIQAVETGASPLQILQDNLVPTLKDIGDRFGRLELFLPEMMLAADAAKAVIAILDPILKESNLEGLTPGRVIIGTVAGDVHDIGKNMVACMLEVNGFEVTDLGTDVSVADFLSTARQQSADIIAMSSLLTTSLPYVKDVISVLRETGGKENFKVIVGGGPVTEEWAMENGADGYGKNAADAVTLAHSLAD
jgi:5-methyltetrahydrofolate--homocysteine methyltransferase